jgi:hypothetical protein
VELRWFHERERATDTQRAEAYRLARADVDEAPDDFRSLYLLALLTCHGFGTEASPAVAADLLRRAASLGSADAEFELFVYYATGLGVPRDETLALEALTRAAEAGQPRALYNMGAFHATGRYVERDMAKAAAWYTRAADSGNPRAAATLAAMYATGDGVEKDLDRARSYLDDAEAMGFEVELVVKPRQARAKCPVCSAYSRRVQSRYARSLSDLPVQGVRVRVRLEVRRFHCGIESCPRKIFCERLPDFAPAYARYSARLTEAFRTLGLALGGQAGSRIAAKLAVPAGDTLLKIVRATPCPGGTPPHVVGIDDWAVRRGQNYGTIVVDLERRSVIDLLYGRETATVR